MGWCSGSFLADEIYSMVAKYLPKEKKEEIATFIYNVFCGQDADCWEWEMSIIKDGRIAEKEGWDID